MHNVYSPCGQFLTANLLMRPCRLASDPASVVDTAAARLKPLQRALMSLVQVCPSAVLQLGRTAQGGCPSPCLSLFFECARAHCQQSFCLSFESILGLSVTLTPWHKQCVLLCVLPYVTFRPRQGLQCCGALRAGPACPS